MTTRSRRRIAQPPEVGPDDLVTEHERACDEIPPGYSDWRRFHELDLFVPTGPQRALLHSDSQTALFWGGIRVGKSTILAIDCARYLRGDHPRQLHHGPTVQLHAGRSWVQMADQLRTLWRFLDPRWFRARVDLSEGQVRGQRLPILTAVAGPGKDSQIRIGTYEMGALAIQGWTIHRSQLDEPPPQPFYTECRSRVITTGGRVRLGFCPTASNAAEIRPGAKQGKIDYLWELVDAGEVHLVHAPLTEESVTPCEGLIRAPYMTRSAIDAFAREIPARDRDMRLGLVRLPQSQGAYFDSWGRHLVRDIGVPGGWFLGIGVDHGSKPGRQRASLVMVRGNETWGQVHVLRHYRSDGRSDDDADGAGVLRMLEETGHTLDDVDFWCGDRAHGGDKKGGIKSNWRLRRAIARQVGIDDSHARWTKKLPLPMQRMWTPYKYENSQWDGCEVLHRLMVREQFTIDPSCGGDDSLAGDFALWNGRMTCEHKDGVDSVRYAAIPMLDSRWHRVT